MHRTPLRRPNLPLALGLAALPILAACPSSEAAKPAGAPAEEAEAEAQQEPAQEPAKKPAKKPAQKPEEPAITWTQSELEATSLKIQGQVEVLRGAKFSAVVPVKLSSKAELVDYAVERNNRMDPAPKRAADQTVMRMLALIPPDMDLEAELMRFLREQVGGFYDPTTKAFYLMDNCPPPLARYVLSHELGHALDDQLHDIDGKLKPIAELTDAAGALWSVVEGSGTAVQLLWTAKYGNLLELLPMLGMVEDQTKQMASSPMIVWKPILAFYTAGASFLARGGSPAEVKVADLDLAFRSPPLSTEQVLHPEKYWEERTRDDPTPVKQVCAELPADWSVIRRDVLGEIAIAIWSIAPGQREARGKSDMANLNGIDYTSPAAEGWDGDEVVLLGKGDAARALRWVTVWDSERDAAEFFGAASQEVPELESALRELAGGKRSLAHASLRYGGEREVILELCYGVKSKEKDQVFAAFQPR